jgi:hypothetical protein
MCADYAIHNDAENNNPHAHVMLTMQDVNENRIFKKIENGIKKKRRNMASFVVSFNQ